MKKYADRQRTEMVFVEGDLVLERESLLMGKLTRIVEGRRVIAKEVDDKRTKEEAAAQQQKSSTCR